MRFSLGQWLVLITADVFLRAILFFAFSFNILFILVALCISAIHLVIFVIINALVSSLRQQTRYLAYKIAILSNAIFAVVFVTIWVSSIKRGHRTACSSYPDCVWIDGKILWSGVVTIFVITAIQIVINVAAVLFAWAIRSRR